MMLEADVQLIKYIVSFVLSVSIALALRIGVELQRKKKFTVSYIIFSILSAFGICYFVNAWIVTSKIEILIKYYQLVIGLTSYLSSTIVEYLYLNREKLSGVVVKRIKKNMEL